MISDDHPVFRHGLAATVRRVIEGAEIVETDSVPTTQVALGAGGWTLLILDLNLPGGEGSELVGMARRVNPGIPIVVCSMLDELLFGPASIDAGADSFVTKTSTKREMETAIRTVMAGGKWYPPRLRLWLEQHRKTNRRPRLGLAALSPREGEVLKLLSAGHSRKEIAGRLGISSSSVGTHRERILQKLGLENTSELLCLAAELRLSGNSGQPWEPKRLVR